jgi:hypothetical protein
MNPYYPHTAAPNYAYAYSATPNHVIQMPQGPYGQPAVVPLPQAAYYAPPPAYYSPAQYPAPSEWWPPAPRTPPSEHTVRCVTKDGKEEWTREWRYTTPAPYTAPERVQEWHYPRSERERGEHSGHRERCGKKHKHKK